MTAVQASGQRGRALLLGIAATLLLMWPALVNRQPFYFPDTPSYVRAADIAAHMASREHVSTVWTARYAEALDRSGPAAGASAATARGNDVAHGNIMSGRSPYFGALLWIAYVASDFWLFVGAQALVAFLLVRMALRLFGFGERALVATVASLALLTSLPFYDAMLMPDALAGLGMLAFLLLAIERGRLGRGERVFLAGVMLLSAVAHLTHILMFAAMAVALAIVGWWRARSLRPVLPLGIAAAVVAAGLASTAITSAVVARVFARPPQLVPLFTSRMIEDGPGRDFILAGCDPVRFAVCGLRQAASADAMHFLWSTDPHAGVFMVVDPATRARLSTDDVAFFLAVARAYPLRTITAMARNSVAQMIEFRNLGLNTGDWEWTALPAPVRARLAASLSGRNAWPAGLLDAIHYATVIAAIGMVAAGLSVARRRPVPGAPDVALWAVLFLVGMVVNDVLGGAVSIPQYRYQARIIWLVPFLGLLTGMLLYRSVRAPARRIAAAAA